MKSIRTSTNRVQSMLALCSAMLYMFSFSVSGLFHPIHHTENKEVNDQLAYDVHCHHLHNAISFENSCKHGAHFSPEHKHCEFCDVLHTKKELNAKNERSNEQYFFQIHSIVNLESVWQSKHISKVYLRGPPLTV